MNVELQFTGLDELRKNLHRLADDRLALKIGRKAVRAGAQVIKTAVRRNLASHRKSRKLWRSIKIVTKTFDRTTPAAFVTSGEPYAHLVEYGTVERFHKKTHKSVGKGPAIGFFRRAWEANIGEASQRMLEKGESELWKAV